MSLIFDTETFLLEIGERLAQTQSAWKRGVISGMALCLRWVPRGGKPPFLSPGLLLAARYVFSLRGEQLSRPRGYLSCRNTRW